jgi:hypothetical protein
MMSVDVRFLAVSIPRAVHTNDLSWVQFALKNGQYSPSDLNRPDLETGLTPVMIAAQSG